MDDLTEKTNEELHELWGDLDADYRRLSHEAYYGDRSVLHELSAVNEALNQIDTECGRRGIRVDDMRYGLPRDGMVGEKKKMNTDIIDALKRILVLSLYKGKIDEEPYETFEKISGIVVGLLFRYDKEFVELVRLADGEPPNPVNPDRPNRAGE